MNNLINYINSEKLEVENKIKLLDEKVKECEYNIEQIENTIVELSKNIDTTYEIFSPNAFDKDYNIVEIEKLNHKKNELRDEIKDYNIKLEKLLEKKKIIDISCDEIKNMNNQLLSNENNTKKLIEKESNKWNGTFNNEVTKLLEYQILKQNHFINNGIKKELESISNKISLCENLVSIDINRAKIEIDRLKEEVRLSEKKLISEMFHVKHLEDKLNRDASEYDSLEKVSLNDELEKFVKEYKKNVKVKLEYSYSGEKVEDKFSNIINIIRIVKEAIDNASNHSMGNIVNIDVIVDNYVIDDYDNINKNEDYEISGIGNDSDMHQINFVIDEDNSEKYNITIKIADNGEGFAMQEDKVFVCNDMFGIYIMNYRAKLLGGKCEVQSEIGLGTTVTVVYEI